MSREHTLLSPLVQAVVNIVNKTRHRRGRHGSRSYGTRRLMWRHSISLQTTPRREGRILVVDCPAAMVAQKVRSTDAHKVSNSSTLQARRGDNGKISKKT